MSEKSAKFETIAKAFSLEKLPRSMAALKGDVPADIINEYREAALTHVAAEMELPGFRKGKVPTDLVLKKVGEMGVLEEAVELFVSDFYPELVEFHKLDVVGRPHIAITKMAPGNPVSLAIEVPLYPELTLPKNWKDLSASIPAEAAAEATDEEINNTIESLRQGRAKDSGLVDAEGKPVPPTLPEVTDEWAKTLGAFETVDALKEQIKKGITEEKARTAKDARRGKIIDALLGKVEVDIPDVFVESELEKILSQMREDVARFGMQMDDYLKRINKNEADLRAEFKDQAFKRAKLQLTLNKLAQEEKIEVEKDLADAEMKHALEHFPDANPELLRVHIETVLRNEKTLRMLEGSTEPMVASSHDHAH